MGDKLPEGWRKPATETSETGQQSCDEREEHTSKKGGKRSTERRGIREKRKGTDAKGA